MNEAISNPTPKPAIIDPTKLKIDCGKKKNPTPMPSMVPPPTAQELLSLMIFSFY